MPQATTFSSDKRALEQLLSDLRDGHLQLPEFQRGWVWDDDHIRDLLASISVAFPIGAIMLLETGNVDVRFKSRPCEGVVLSTPVDPQHYILDGQQRLTSLYQALMMDTPVATTNHRGRDVKRWYYIDMEKAIGDDVDPEEATFSVPEDRIIRRSRHEIIESYATPSDEYRLSVFPLNQVFDYYDWRSKYKAFWDQDAGMSRLWDAFEDQVIVGCFRRYDVPVIELKRPTPKEAVCKVFEKVNTGGVTLTVFELVTASFAADDFDLRSDWEGTTSESGGDNGEGRRDRLQQHPVLAGVSATDFLQAITLMATHQRKRNSPEAAISCKRTDVLKLQLNEYELWADEVERGFIEAARLLHAQKVFSDRDLPYGTQLVPLAAMMALMGVRTRSQPVRDKLALWYWSGVLGELYGGAVETRFARDVEQVPHWIEGGEPPNTIVDANFAADRLLSLRTRNSAAYKGLHALLMRDGARDFISGEPIEAALYFDESIDIHHIFPREHCKQQGIPSSRFDSIVNKTAISSRTNRIIGGRPPSQYLSMISERHDLPRAELDDMLESHLIDAEALRRDDFDSFFEHRRDRLIERIEATIQTRVTRDDFATHVSGQE